MIDTVMNIVIKVKQIFWGAYPAFFTLNALKWTLLKMTFHHISSNILICILIYIFNRFLFRKAIIWTLILFVYTNVVNCFIIVHKVLFAFTVILVNYGIILAKAASKF